MLIGGSGAAGRAGPKESVPVIAFYFLLILIGSLKGRGLSLIALWGRKCKVGRTSTFKRPSSGLNSLLSPEAEDALQRNCWLFTLSTWLFNRLLRFREPRLLILGLGGCEVRCSALLDGFRSSSTKFALFNITGMETHVRKHLLWELSCYNIEKLNFVS